MVKEKRIWDGDNYVIDNLDWIKEQIIKISDLQPNEIGRNLIITPIKDNYGKVGTIFFALNGSPPRGYAIFTGIDRANGVITFISMGRCGKKKTYVDTSIENKLLKSLIKGGDN